MQHHDASPKSTQIGTLEHRTMAYSMAAAAAGVSLMALATPAEGKVVITTHINIAVTSTVSLDPGFPWVLTRRTFPRRP